VAEELSFARKASGLVRGLSMLDAFGVGFMNQGLTPSIWFVITFGLGVFLGGNLIIASVISVVLAGIGFPIVWGVLGGSMPRAGAPGRRALPARRPGAISAAGCRDPAPGPLALDGARQ